MHSSCRSRRPKACITAAKESPEHSLSRFLHDKQTGSRYDYFKVRQGLPRSASSEYCIHGGRVSGEQSLIETLLERKTLRAPP